MRQREFDEVGPEMYVSLRLPSSQNMSCCEIWPEMVTETLRLPLRTVVASSSATRSSRSAQQLPPRSAAVAGPIPPTINAATAAIEMRLSVVIDPPFICLVLHFLLLPARKQSAQPGGGRFTLLRNCTHAPQAHAVTRE